MVFLIVRIKYMYGLPVPLSEIKRIDERSMLMSDRSICHTHLKIVASLLLFNLTRVRQTQVTLTPVLTCCSSVDSHGLVFRPCCVSRPQTA